MSNVEIPSLCEWAGGPEVLLRLITRFYEKVPNDPILAPVFAGMNPQHARHVAAFIAEVFGGEKSYTSEGGSHAAMIGRHLGRRLKEEQRKRWISLMLETADEIGLPVDPEFRRLSSGILSGARALQSSTRRMALYPRRVVLPCQFGTGARLAVPIAVRRAKARLQRVRDARWRHAITRSLPQ